MKKKLLPIKDFDLESMNLKNITKQMKLAGGFMAKNLGIATDILEEMIKDKKCLKMISFPANLIATGTRGIIKELIKRKVFNVVITTSGTLDHDLARIWKNYYHGSFQANDVELNKLGIHREGNVFIPKSSYGIILEKKLQPLFESIYKEKKELATYELVWEIGKRLEREKKKEESIIYWAWKNKTYVFVPGITDGAFGFQLWFFWQNKHRDFNINVLKDEQKLSELLWKKIRTGALILGGGISKHHTIWWNQFKDGLDYAVYITTALEYDGSLSGAKPKEAISWEQINKKARTANVICDATIALPLMVASLKERKVI